MILAYLKCTACAFSVYQVALVFCMAKTGQSETVATLSVRMCFTCRTARALPLEYVDCIDTDVIPLVH